MPGREIVMNDRETTINFQILLHMLSLYLRSTILGTVYLLRDIRITSTCGFVEQKPTVGCLGVDVGSTVQGKKPQSLLTRTGVSVIKGFFRILAH